MSERNTNRKSPKASEPDVRPEYDFSAAVRGKYYKRYIESTNVVVLEPDIARRFKNSASVNKALRAYLKESTRGLPAGSTAPARKRAAR